MNRQLAIGTLVILKKPYETDKGSFTNGRVAEILLDDRYALNFEGYGNQHGLLKVDFHRREFILASSE